MSLLIRTGTGRNNISWGGGTTTKANYLRRTGTGRNNIGYIQVSSNGTHNILERTSTGRNNIRWQNTTFTFTQLSDWNSKLQTLQYGGSASGKYTNGYYSSVNRDIRANWTIQGNKILNHHDYILGTFRQGGDTVEIALAFANTDSSIINFLKTFNTATFVSSKFSLNKTYSLNKNGIEFTDKSTDDFTWLLIIPFSTSEQLPYVASNTDINDMTITFNK